MNTVLTIILILALAIAIFFDYIRIVQYIKSRKLIEESNKWTENKFTEVNSKLVQLQTNIELIYAMEEDNRTYKRCMDAKTKDMQKQLVNISREQYKKLKDIQDTLHKIEKRK